MNKEDQMQAHPAIPGLHLPVRRQKKDDMLYLQLERLENPYNSGITLSIHLTELSNTS